MKRSVGAKLAVVLLAIALVPAAVAFSIGGVVLRSSLADASASTLDRDVGAKAQGKTGATSEAAADVGKRVAAAATAAGVTRVLFDRGGFLFHGRVKALADAAREGGLEF